MYRTHTCGELGINHINEKVVLSGWVQRLRNLGGMTFIDLRDRYGITQLVFNMESDAALCEEARKLGREFVIKVHGAVAERINKNPQLATGEVEVLVQELDIVNRSKTPPFTIEDDTDGGEELRMKYRYIDLRRQINQKNFILRHQMAIETRKYLHDMKFLEVETPYLIKSTPEGARDFVVPSRLHEGTFYALPQSPQTFKQLLMVAGFDRYFQLVKCFRDEDFRADRQPEFTQIDCEMAFVTQEDVLTTFEGLVRHLFKQVKEYDIHDIPRMPYDEAMEKYGSDKPDTRFGMEFVNLTHLVKDKGFPVFDAAELVAGITVPGCAEYSRKQIDALTDFVKKPQLGAKGLIYVKYNADGTIKSSVDKFFSPEALAEWAEKMDAKRGDLMLIIGGDKRTTQKSLCELRLEMGSQLNLRCPNQFSALWVTDFPLLEWDEDSQRFHAMHHPFTSPRPEDIPLLDTDPVKVRANAYDLVINGVEIGGGSIRIYDRELQNKVFVTLGFTQEEAQKQFGFLMDAFEYGAPPHGGIAFGFDRWVAMFAGSDSIREVIAFPKNNAGRDLMIESPSEISPRQLEELSLSIRTKKE